ncbi:hypothetical protein PRZ48_014602 [Zasmidium cellare]|uniref:Uncharacterized protein n=1 Tax=Zasmidium cellare TaxID=395010 RepID=A0ABR0DYQ5_ZASCE|nr:hypothetical protein PRZ48_014602 [Zasmidium cellare]
MAQGSNTATLRQRLEALPQELYDEIYDLTFTPDGGTRNISDTYRPPAQLQVSRATRLQFSKAYFGDGAVFRVQTEEVLGKWLPGSREPDSPSDSGQEDQLAGSGETLAFVDGRHTVDIVAEARVGGW